MLLFYVRHGHPTYDPDALLPLGRKEAEAVAKRLALFGVDKIFASSSNRAMETAQPTCDLLQKEMTILDFANESYAYKDLSMKLTENRRCWVFQHPEARRIFTDPTEPQNRAWYDHPKFEGYRYKEGIERIQRETDGFLASLGYEHIPGRGIYKAVAPNNERVALFAHQGFGIAFLSCLLDIPYPQFSVHFDLSHSSLTVIEFPEDGEFSIPRVCTLSSDAHLYREGLPTEYNSRFRY